MTVPKSPNDRSCRAVIGRSEVAAEFLERLLPATAVQPLDWIETFAAEQRGPRHPVGEGSPDEAKIALPRQAGQSGVLAANVVPIVEVVDADERVTATKELLSAIHADETGGAGEEDCQAC